MPKKQWVYRPTDKEHELLTRAMEQYPEYGSVAQFVREATLRLIHDGDLRKLYTEAGQLIEDLADMKSKFLDLVLRHSED